MFVHSSRQVLNSIKRAYTLCELQQVKKHRKNKHIVLVNKLQLYKYMEIGPRRL